MLPLKDKRILITGGTGSLGQVLVRRLLTGEMGQPRKIIVFSRDEAKQHDMRLEYLHSARGDRRGHLPQLPASCSSSASATCATSTASLRALRDADVVFNAAALKQVPTCEYFPCEAVRTNIAGAENIVRAIREHDLPVETVVGISTDKACKPVNVMGMTKAIQERVFIQANMRCPQTRFVCVRYGNVLASRGSVIPLFHEQIRSGGPVTITTAGHDALPAQPRPGGRHDLRRGPRGAAAARPTSRACPSRQGDRHRRGADRRAADRDGRHRHPSRREDPRDPGLRGGGHRTVDRGGYYAIRPMLPELRGPARAPAPRWTASTAPATA